MKEFLCICNFDSVDVWRVDCSSVEEARYIFLKYLTSRFRKNYIQWIQIYELVHDEDFNDDN